MTSKGIGGLVTLHRYGPEHFGRINKGAAFDAYGETQAARKVRAMDVASKRKLTDAQWESLMRRRAKSFGVPIERLMPRLRTKKTEAEPATTSSSAERK